jgi:hypothetical protein
VGDRGMITSTRIRNELKPAGIDRVTRGTGCVPWLIGWPRKKSIK